VNIKLAIPLGSVNQIRMQVERMRNKPSEMETRYFAAKGHILRKGWDIEFTAAAEYTGKKYTTLT
jgi:hypothetical protein